MMDRTPTKVLPNGAIRYGVYDEAGNFLRYEYIKLEDMPTQVGTALNKATFLDDAAEIAIWGSAANRTPSEALKKLQSLDLKIQYGYSARSGQWTTVPLSGFSSFVQVMLTLGSGNYYENGNVVLNTNLSTSSFQWGTQNGIPGVYWMAIGR